MNYREGTIVGRFGGQYVEVATATGEKIRGYFSEIDEAGWICIDRRYINLAHVVEIGHSVKTAGEIKITAMYGSSIGNSEEIMRRVTKQANRAGLLGGSDV